MFNPNKVTRDDQNRPLAVYSMCNTMSMLIVEIDHDLEQVLWRFVTDGDEENGSSLLEYEFKDDEIEPCFEAMGRCYYISEFMKL